MKMGVSANNAVEAMVSEIEAQRLSHPSYLDRIVFSFPRVMMDESGKWRDGSPFLAAAAVVARNPETRVNKGVDLRYYGVGHKIPSVIVPLEGIEDVEYHVSRSNMEMLLSVGCVVFQRYKKGFGVRIPLGHPLLTGQPFQFEEI